MSSEDKEKQAIGKKYDLKQTKKLKREDEDQNDHAEIRTYSITTVEDKTWTRGSHGPLILDPVRGPPIMDRVHIQFFGLPPQKERNQRGRCSRTPATQTLKGNEKQRRLIAGVRVIGVN